MGSIVQLKKMYIDLKFWMEKKLWLLVYTALQYLILVVNVGVGQGLSHELKEHNAKGVDV